MKLKQNSHLLFPDIQMSKQFIDIYDGTIMDSLHSQQNDDNDDNKVYIINNKNYITFADGTPVKFKKQILTNPIVDEPDNLGKSITITGHEGNVICYNSEGKQYYPDGNPSIHDISIQTSEEENMSQTSLPSNITLLSLPSENISIASETQNQNNKEIQTDISCPQPNIRLAIDYNTNQVKPAEITQARQYTKIIDFMNSMVTKDCWLLPPINYNSLNIKENKKQWFFNSENCKCETKMQNMKKYRKEGKTKNYANQHISCAEAILTLISIINFQQLTIEELTKDNAELAGLINKYNPQIKNFNELLKRIIKKSDKKSLNCINNQITKFSWRILHEEMSDSNLFRISAETERGNYLETKEYQNKIRKCLLNCKNYLNGCYSKNVNKNRRILYEMYRIFGMIKEDPQIYEEISITQSDESENMQE